MNRFLLISILLLGMATPALGVRHPIFALNLNLNYSDMSYKSKTTEVASTHINFNFNMGFMFYDVVKVGLTMTAAAEALTSPGVHFGLLTKRGFSSGLSILVNPEWNLGDQGKLTGASGAVLNLGWRFNYRDWAFGPLMIFNYIVLDQYIDAEGVKEELDDPVTFSTAATAGGIWLFF